MEVTENKHFQFYRSKWSNRLFAVRDASNLGIYYIVYLEDFLLEYKAGIGIAWAPIVTEEFVNDFVISPLAEILYA